MSTDTILDAFETGETLTVRDLTERAGVSETKARKRLKELVDAGALTEDATNRVKRYTRPRFRAARGSNAEASARDEHVFHTLAAHQDGLTHAELAELSGALGLTYVSLWRLRLDGRVEKVSTGTRTPKWRVTP